MNDTTYPSQGSTCGHVCAENETMCSICFRAMFAPVGQRTRTPFDPRTASYEDQCNHHGLCRMLVERRKYAKPCGYPTQPDEHGTICILLRLNWLASQKRAEWLRAHTPSVYVLPKRPSFTPDNKTDATDYAWMVWGDAKPTVAILDSGAAQ